MAQHILLTTIQSFSDEIEKVKRNHDLSAEGRKNALNRINVQIQAYRGVALRTLRADWSELRGRWKDHEKDKLWHEDRAAARWNYDRLNYEARAIESKLSEIARIEDFEIAYDKIATSGDQHKARAVAEIGIGLATSKWRSQSGHLVRRMKDDLEKLMLTDDLKLDQENGNRLARETIDLIAVTDALNEYFDAGFYGRTEFQDLKKGVTVETKVNDTADSDRFMATTVTVDTGEGADGGDAAS